eukprot:scaffold1505_cov256-Pinguiococcus_pyrenoidosus.AAC.8
MSTCLPYARLLPSDTAPRFDVASFAGHRAPICPSSPPSHCENMCPQDCQALRRIVKALSPQSRTKSRQGRVRKARCLFERAATALESRTSLRPAAGWSEDSVITVTRLQELL